MVLDQKTWIKMIGMHVLVTSIEALSSQAGLDYYELIVLILGLDLYIV